MSRTTTPPAARRRNIVLAALTAVLILIDGALAAIGQLVESGLRGGNLTGSEAATFILIGFSAVFGSVVLLLATVALARGGHGIAKAASALAWLRAAGVIVALTAIAASLGLSAIAGPFETFGAAVAVIDALFAVFVASVAERRTRHG